ncbi:MAG: nucleotide sugar dehydrogenase [Armatimonadota bacterium]|nr:nucleotide sugar dehydrogenase [Armatimonadota bacterium]MDR7453268.1 nucleotide sugar dehydrogenase [Armatimonadota bacterium]MDR7457388.1 nucleotide sugar dehydrogenase [Armatimonadota bacterium]MDR7497514.1 nucleotide sugar dehydrogenase [Armatimonadota bacterium]MDR7511010.1 nucleotide sugar dehydrogenase [Armatimonadota bacterium]
MATSVAPPVVKPEAAVRFDELLRTREARLAVIGLGYVGLPLAVAYADAGFRVLGVDVDAARVEALRRGRSPIRDVPSPRIAAAQAAGRFRPAATGEALGEADAIFICVPTPYTRNKQPDTSNIASAARAIAERLRPGQLVVLRSTSYPGTTQELVLPILAAGGLRVGRDFFLAFAPERVDPGRTDYTVRNTPVIVGGVDAESTRRARRLLEQLGAPVQAVSSPAAAEMAKLLENVFRNVNIALVNQLAMLCDRMGLDIWEIVDAAATKPYGFMAFHPGPGIGGHCIPVDPYYLAWRAREYDFHMDFIELAARVNEEMPYHTVTKTLLALNGKRATNGAPRVLVLGVTFKKDIDDYRESPALKIMELLIRRGARVSYHDPYVPRLTVAGRSLASRPLSAATLRAADCVLIVADHSAFDYPWIVRHARLVVDTRNATRRVTEGREKITRL